MEMKPGLKSMFGWQDAALVTGGVAGLLLVLFVAPAEHPHSTVSGHIPYEQAVDSARAFAQRSGSLQLADAEADATIRYDGRVLNGLQKQYGRDEAMRMLREDDVPAYSWEVKWTAETDDDTEDLGMARLSMDGRPLGLHVESSAIPRQAYHEAALAPLFDGPIPLDSLPPNRFAFRLEGAEREGRLDASQLRSDRIFFERSDAEKLALFHLRSSRFAGVPVRVDSVFASGSDGLVTATVRVSSEDEEVGRYFSADVEVMPSGTLVRLEPRFVPEEEDDEGALDAEDVREVSTFIVYVLLALILVVVFFRRLNARVVDTKTAIRDGLIAGAAAAVAMSTQLTTDVQGSSPMEAIGFVVGLVVVGLAGGILIFFVSGAALSMARERWDHKLQTLALVRSLYVRNVPVGSALARGTFAGFALAGLSVLFVIAIDGLWLHFSDGGEAFFGKLSAISIVLRDVAGTFFWATFLTLGVVLGIGALFLRKKGGSKVAFPAVVLAFALMQIAPWGLRPLLVEYVMAGVYGVAVAGIFWRYDALTALATLFVFTLSASLIPNFGSPSTPEFAAGIIMMCAVGGLAVVGAIGVMSVKRSSEVPVIVPEYIKELAQQERFKRELELAREVQLSFLPSKTPEVLGLDLASVCLPANEVGGDYYDFFRMPGDRLGVVVGDVSGKGMQAAFYMTLMKGILQSLNTSLTRPSAILSGANELFRMNAPRGIFMSIVLGVIDLENRTWTCARAGHNPMLIHRNGAEYPEEVKPRGAAIGLASDPIFSTNIEEAIVHIEPGDLLLIYTDGITEAMNRSRDLYDEKRLEEAVARARGRSAADVLSSIIEDVEQFTGDAPRHDDMTMVAIRILNHV